MSEPKYTEYSQLIRLATVVAMTGLGRSSIYKMEADGRFPDRVRLTNRSIAWPREQVEEWMRSRPRVRQTQKGDV